MPRPCLFKIVHCQTCGAVIFGTKEATVALLARGDFVGEESITSDHPLRTTSALDITACSVLRIEKKAMLDALHKEHAFSDLLVAFLVVRNSQIQADLVDQLFNSAEKRLARALLLLTRFGKEDRLEPVPEDEP